MVVVDNFYERLDLRSFCLAGLGHATGDLGGVAFYAGDEGMGECVRFGAGIERLYDDDLSKPRLEEVLDVD